MQHCLVKQHENVQQSVELLNSETLKQCNKNAIQLAALIVQ